MYLPWNAPVEALGRTLAFGEVESGDEAIAPSVEGERACDGNGDQNGDDGDDGGDGDKGGTMSGSSIHSMRVKEVLLAEESQYMRQSRRKRDGNSPVSSQPPTNPADRPYRGVRRRRRCRRIKTVLPAKVSQAPKVKMAYQICVNVTQPPANTLKRPHGLVRH